MNCSKPSGIAERARRLKLDAPAPVNSWLFAASASAWLLLPLKLSVADAPGCQTRNTSAVPLGRLMAPPVVLIRIVSRDRVEGEVKVPTPTSDMPAAAMQYITTAEPPSA